MAYKTYLAVFQSVTDENGLVLPIFLSYQVRNLE